MSLADRAVARGIAVLAAVARSELPADIQIEAAADGIRLRGRALRRRWLTDVRLRALGLLVRGRR